MFTKKSPARAVFSLLRENKASVAVQPEKRLEQKIIFTNKGLVVLK